MLEINDKEEDKMFALMDKVSTHPEDLTRAENKLLRKLGLEVK